MCEQINTYVVYIDMFSLATHEFYINILKLHFYIKTKLQRIFPYKKQTNKLGQCKKNVLGVAMKQKNHILYFQVICNSRILRHSCYELKSNNFNLTSITGRQNKFTSNNVSQSTRFFPAPADLSARGSQTTGLELLTSNRCSQLIKQ